MSEEIKKPSLKGMENMGYLGHFAKDMYIQQGHNDVSAAAEAILINQKSLEKDNVAEEKAESDAEDAQVQKVANSVSARKQSAAEAAKQEQEYKASPSGKKANYENAPMATDKYK